MPSTLVTAPAVQPVTLAKAKENLRITHDEEDSLISDLIDAAARFMVDNDGLCLVHQTWRYFIDDVSLAHRINRFPVQTISAAVAYNTEGHASVIDPALIDLESRTRPAILTFESATLGTSAANGAEIDIVFGYGETPVELPDTLKRAVLALVSHWYAFRADAPVSEQPVSLPDQYTRLVAPYRLKAMGA